MSHDNHPDSIDDRLSGDKHAEKGAYKRTIGVEDPSELAGSRYRLLVPVLNENSIENIERIVQAAATIARDRDGDLLVLCVVDVPRQTPYEALTDDQPRVRNAHEAVERLLQVAEETDVEAEGIVCFTHQESKAILDIAGRYECDGVFMIVDSDQSQRRRLLSGDTVETIVSHADTDVFVEKLGEGAYPPERILLTASGGPHSGLAAETARVLARASDAHIDVVHFLEENPSTDGRDEPTEVLRAAENVLGDLTHESELVRAESVPEAIVTRSNEYDLTVLGAPTKGLLTQFIFGTVPDSVNQRAENAVVMAKQRTGRTSAFQRWITGDTNEET